MNFDSKKNMPRYYVIIFIMTLVGIYILGNAAYLMFAKREYWQKVSELLVKDNVPIPAKRGNILSSDGQIMASSLPEYKIYMDFVAYDKDSLAREKLQAWRDTILFNNLDSIADGLHAIFPDKSAAYFKSRLKLGHKLKRRNWLLYSERISYIQYKECKKLPLLRETPNKGGFYVDESKLRKKPYGSLASRTLGAVYASKDSARYGLELSYDSILRGVPGVSHRTKVRNKWLNIVDKPPVDGCDIVTTIDVSMQDAAEKAILKQLKNINGELGIVVLMEVATGDIKAIVNMTRGSNGEYSEVKNNAVADLMEPGSTFKTASMMVAMEDGKVSKNDFIETGNGQWEMHGRIMKDHNWRKGGYGTISVPEVLMYSSNIGISRIIDENYKDNPEKFVDGLKKVGMGVPLNLPLVGSGEARIRRPNKDRSNWSKTALPWMSIGYETQIPPIATLTFYNAIANGGKMVKPRFVKSVKRNDEVLYEFPVEVIKEQICSPKTLKDIQDILEMVVSKGLGKQAGCRNFKVSGKTGTAQVSQGKLGYHGGGVKYLISFCGYYPSDKPKYSCIVMIKKSGLPASGGGHCGPVFSEIAQSVMAKGVYRDVQQAADSTSIFVPDVLNGNINSAGHVLEELGIPVNGDNIDNVTDPVWGISSNNGNNVSLVTDKTPLGMVPDVSGYGARDAVYILKNAGLKVVIEGVGHVVEQSIPPHTKLIKGQTIKLKLKY